MKFTKTLLSIVLIPLTLAGCLEKPAPWVPNSDAIFADEVDQDTTEAEKDKRHDANIELDAVYPEAEFEDYTDDTAKEEVDLYSDLIEVKKVDTQDIVQDEAASPNEINEFYAEAEIPCSKKNYYPDNDEDGYGTLDGAILGCSDVVPEKYSDKFGDCDDQDPEFYPGTLRNTVCGVTDLSPCKLGKTTGLCQADGSVKEVLGCDAIMPKPEDLNGDGKFKPEEQNGIDDNCDSVADFDVPDGLGNDEFGMVGFAGPEGAEFQMGCEDSDPNAIDVDYCKSDSPKHAVFLSPFYMDPFEMSISAYRKCVGAGVCSDPQQPDANYDNMTKQDRPVTGLDWYQMKQACTHQGKKLPTAAQWEFAATNGGKCQFPTGDTCINPFKPVACMTMGNFGMLCGSTASMSIGAKMSFWKGKVQDLGDNVEEWMLDAYHKDFYGASTYFDPVGTLGANKEIRGGSFESVSDVEFAATNRKSASPYSYLGSRGGRCTFGGAQ